MTTIAYTAPAGLVASIVVNRTQRFKYLIVTGWVLLASGLGSNVTMEPDSSKAVLYAPHCLAVHRFRDPVPDASVRGYVEASVRDGLIPPVMMVPSELAEVAYEIIESFPKTVQEACRWVYAGSMRTVWWVMTGISIVGLLVSLTCRNAEVKGELSGSQKFQDERPAQRVKRHRGLAVSAYRDGRFRC
ncbi:hypothetical protein HJFPF1_04138 [Paramyrothecium foliicola]|nr:hypothetical protein HJFPF1_04138 [Paramyrothecium foliicola]